jgi:hypothetical protein
MRISDEELARREADWTEILSFVRKKGPQHGMLGTTLAFDVIEALLDLRDLRKLAREAHEAFSMYHSSDGRERATKVFSALKTHLEEK